MGSGGEGSTSSMMWVGAATQAISTAGGAFAQSQALQSQGAFQRQMYDFNKDLANLKAEDALDRGKVAVQDHKKQVKKLIGSQRAALAAQGIELDSGSSLDIQENSAYMGAIDAIKIKNNAWREAWGYKSDALSFGAQGNFSAMAASNAATNTLLTGGLNAAAFGAQAGYYYSQGSSGGSKGGGSSGGTLTTGDYITAG